MKLATGILVVGLSVTLASVASAACGGGGYHPSKKPVETTAQGAPAAPGQVSRVSISTPIASPGDGVYFDSQPFDRISAQLGMDQKQVGEVVKAINDLRAEISKLRQTDAAALKNFRPTEQFEKRITTILDARQMEIYRKGVAVSTATK